MNDTVRAYLHLFTAILFCIVLVLWTRQPAKNKNPVLPTMAMFMMVGILLLGISHSHGLLLQLFGLHTALRIASNLEDLGMLNFVIGACFAISLGRSTNRSKQMTHISRSHF